MNQNQNQNQNQNHDDALETRIAACLREEARGELPDWVLISTFEQTRMEPQRRGIHGWSATLRRRSWKEPAPSSQRRLTMFSALRATVAAVLIAVIGAGLAVNLFEEPEVSPGGAPAAESPASPEPSGSPAPSATAGGAPVSLWTSQGDPHDQLRTPGQIALALMATSGYTTALHPGPGWVVHRGLGKPWKRRRGVRLHQA